MERRLILLAGIFILLVLLFSGCEKIENEKSPGLEVPEMEKGILAIWATDAPFPIDLIDQAKVTVVRIELKREDDAVFEFFSDDTVTFDLLTLRNGIVESLASEEIPPGSYDQMRLYTDRASVRLVDGRTSVLKVPGGPQSGLKILFAPAITIQPGMIANALLDFNLSRSFILKGNPKKTGDIRGFNFRPVVRAVVMDSTGMVTGNVADVAGAALANAEVWISSDTVVASTYTNNRGAYAILGIPEGTFTITAALEGFVSREAEGIQVSAMEKTICDFQLTAAN